MQLRVKEAIVEAVSRGYQVDPWAVKRMEELAGTLDVMDVVLKALELKASVKDQSKMLLVEDVNKVVPQDYLPKQGMSARTIVQPVEEVTEDELEIVDAGSESVGVEGLEGYRSLFGSRFEKLYRIASRRPGGGRIRTVGELGKEEEARVAGLVMEKRVRKDRLELALDDKTGRVRLFIRDRALVRAAQEVLLDQMVIVDLDRRKGVNVVKSVYSPDIPERAPTFSKKRVYAVLTSDLHIGSRAFLEDAFRRFLAWLCGTMADEDLIARLRYVIIGGDLVDGVGVYPGQDSELKEVSIHRQYRMAAELLSSIPQSVKVVISPGNHDAVRQAVPQPPIAKKYAEPVYALDNVVMVGSPARVRLNGVNVLVYHGRSLDDVVALTPGASYSEPVAAMKLLLKARHLAPIYGGRTPLAPCEEDRLVIDDVPDIFHAGHVHTVSADMYRGTLMVNSGTWQSKTAYQMNMGVEPTPGIVPIVDLSTLEVLTRSFG